MAEEKTIPYGRRKSRKTGQWEYQVGDRMFKNKQQARAYYDKQIILLSDKTQKKIDDASSKAIKTQETIEDLQYKIDTGKASPQDEKILELKNKELKRYYVAAGIDTTGMGAKIDTIPKKTGILSRLFSGSPDQDKNKWVTRRTRELFSSYGKSPDAVPEEYKGRRFQYAKVQAEKEWDERNEQADPLGILK